MLEKSADTARLKQRLLREMVQENVDLVQGVRTRRVERRPKRWPLWTALFAAVPALFLAGSTRTTSSTSASAPAAPAHGESASAPLAPAEARLAAPRAIDPAVFPLAVRRIVIDPGHGGTNRGTISPQGLVEKALTLDIGLRLGLLLQEGGYEVVLTRHDDANVSLAERTQIANRAQADAFVSIHVNWFTTRQSRAVETYHLGATEDPELNRLAAAENGDSGYSLTDFKRLLEGVYAGVRHEESRRFAESVDGALYRSLKVVNPALTDRGVKTAPFVVLIGTEMPAVLAEVGCLSNDKEAELLADDAYRQRIALALYGGVRAFAERGAAPDQRLAAKNPPQKGT